MRPRNSHFFGPLNKHLYGKRFATDAGVKQAVTSWLQTLYPYFFYTSVQALVPRWGKCLHVNSDYVEVCCLPCTIMCHIYAHLPTCSMEQSPSWEANRFSASQEISAYTEPQGSLPHSQVPATCSYPQTARPSPCPHMHFLNIHLNSILLSTPGSSKWSISLRFSHQSPVYNSPLPHTRYVTHPSHTCHLYIEVKKKSSSQGLSCPFLETSRKFGFDQNVREYMNKAGNLVTPQANKTQMIRQKFHPNVS